MIAIPARCAATASGLRFAAEVNARALVRAVWRAGGEPVSIHPAEPADVPVRLGRFDGVLLPGGGDLAPHHYGGVCACRDDDSGINTEQDGFDLAVARYCLDAGLPLLAVCRGLQVVNTALGGSLENMDGPGHEHRHFRHQVVTQPDSVLEQAMGAGAVTVSCDHHQRVARTGSGVTVTSRAGDGTVESLEVPGASGWFVAVQWHPEDTAHEDPAQQGLFDALVSHSS
ncbi:gamma-glutamyl-gamma-aminobutyrate hydrolase family protein [Streptomyces sp. CB03238]|uniref:gamma-glutamyl-gamma-aminobutyrate hydrolase family protein n=1 Tax=Streptomyces sp. CB03238 TaxID=1907777 RepID=UPI001F4DC5D4|nr:gamma-glutamyl-gamma-aminobutyrate hydrolase family protein [Streptomyces sp. CB03238]